MQELSAQQVQEIIASMAYDPENAEEAAEWRVAVTRQINVWLARGDGVAVYRNEDMSHSGLGEYQILSYGSPAAQLETDTPPTTLPDIDNKINWRFQLKGGYKGDAV